VGRPRKGELQQTRIPEADWLEMHELAGPQRAEIIRQFIAWYLRRPGAAMPGRPPVRTPLAGAGGTPAITRQAAAGHTALSSR